MRSLIPKRFSKQMAIEIALARCLMTGNVFLYMAIYRHCVSANVKPEIDGELLVNGAIMRGDPETIITYFPDWELTSNQKSTLLTNAERFASGTNAILALEKILGSVPLKALRSISAQNRNRTQMARRHNILMGDIDRRSVVLAALSGLDKPFETGLELELIEYIMSLNPAIFGKDPVQFLKTAWYPTF